MAGITTVEIYWKHFTKPVTAPDKFSLFFFSFFFTLHLRAWAMCLISQFTCIDILTPKKLNPEKTHKKIRSKYHVKTLALVRANMHATGHRWILVMYKEITQYAYLARRDFNYHKFHLGPKISCVSDSKAVSIFDLRPNKIWDYVRSRYLLNR